MMMMMKIMCDVTLNGYTIGLISIVNRALGTINHDYDDDRDV